MNDDFEELLARQPLRPIPPEWRAEILAPLPASAAEMSSGAAPWWKALLWPSPIAWVGVACGWVLIVGMNMAARQPAPVIDATALHAPSEQAFTLIIQERQALEEISQSQQRPPEPLRKPFPPGAYIGRRDDNEPT